MKKFICIGLAVLILFGCTDKELETSKKYQPDISLAKHTSDGSSLEADITEILYQNGYVKPEDVVDYEVKGNYLFIVNYNTVKGTDVIILKNKEGKFQWIKAIDAGSETLISADENATKENDKGPFFLILQPDDPKVTGVKTFGHYAKMIHAVRPVNDNLTKEIKWWVYAADDLGISPQEYLENRDKVIEYIY